MIKQRLASDWIFPLHGSLSRFLRVVTLKIRIQDLGFREFD